MSSRQYLIVIEKADGNYSAYSPDLPGCVAVGKTREQTEAKMQTAIQMHIEGLLEDHLRIPAPHSSAEYVQLTIPARAKETPSKSGPRSAGIKKM
ncbi:MAG TPA: type II toxin-antitoxin system HicB family antitoxin [bacterium]|jgi:predicted RNase H-like HicB family nuclease